MVKQNLLLIGMMALMIGSVCGASNQPSEGKALPEFELLTPIDPQHKAYLGVGNDRAFTIPMIDAKAVIIEIFSMYCPYCQREAPTINKLFNKIENDQVLKKELKLIGIGVGNSEFEVNHFKNTYNVPFPLFADGDFKIHKLLGEVRTPFFIVVKINDDGTHKIIFSQLGGIKDTDEFLKTIKKRIQL